MSISPRKGKSKSRKPPRQLGATRRLSAVEEGYEMLKHGKVDGAITGLEQALDHLVRGHAAQPPPRPSARASKAPSGSVSGHAEEDPQGAGGSLQAAWVIQLLCICHSRKQEWEAVLKYASMVLDPGASLPASPSLRQELQLRRAVALSRLAGPRGAALDGAGGAEVGRRPRGGGLDAESLARAERDLDDAVLGNPRDESLRRCMDVVAFLQAQAKARGRDVEALGGETGEALLELALEDSEEEDREPPQRELRGLARIRAMSP